MRCLFSVVCILSLSAFSLGQSLPGPIKRYLDGNFRGWELAGECYEEGNTRVLTGDFDGDTRRDFAVKFVRGDKGFLMAFLARGRDYRPHYLHIYTAEDAKNSDLKLFEKGGSYENEYTRVRLKFDSPADFRCESDSGGVHAYRDGKFIGY